MDQHELVVQVLKETGGQTIESVVPADYKGKIADILFPFEDIIFEVKSLTTDRAADDTVLEAVGDMLARNTHLGAPIIFGSVAIKLNDLDPRVAANTLRILGKRVQTEARDASKQINATKVALGRPKALGVVALITPPFKLDRNSIAWLMGDAMREGRCSGIDLVFLIETPLAAFPRELTGNSFLSLHTRADRSLPEHLIEKIGIAWERVTGQPGGRADSDEFHKFGATS